MDKEVNIFVWVLSDPVKFEAYYQQGWALSHIRRGHWGHSYLMKHEEM